jgi:DNA-binding MarR family transcriptional regulator
MKSKTNKIRQATQADTAMALKQSLREMSIQLSMLSYQVGLRLGLRHVDLGCLDLVTRHGPLSPSSLARGSGLHPATLTGVLDRLERDGWIHRERDPSDRRAVILRASPKRVAEVVAQYTQMNVAMDKLCAGHTKKELELITDFLRKTTQAGAASANALADEAVRSP